MIRFLLAALLALVPITLSAQSIQPGPVTLPTAFSGTTCDNCAMVNPVFTGSPTVNGAGIVTSVNSVAPVSGNVVVPTTTFVNGFTPTSAGTLANLYTNAPCNASRVNQFAIVNDLYGVVTDAMRCTYFGSSFGYQWREPPSSYAAPITVTGGTVTIACNVTPPAINLQGSLASNLTLAFSTTNCTPGAKREILVNATMGIYTVTASGLVGGIVSKLLGATSSSVYIYDSLGWRAF